MVTDVFAPRRLTVGDLLAGPKVLMGLRRPPMHGSNESFHSVSFFSRGRIQPWNQC